MALLHTPASKITVVPNGVNENFRRQSEAEIARVRLSLQIPTSRYILSVCSVEPRKNLASLLKAWSMVKADQYETTLVIAGGRGRRSVFREPALGDVPSNVLFVGYIQDGDLPALYSGARAFIYPSLYEGFGLPVLEAMACGTKVITSNTTALPEVACTSTLMVDPLSQIEIANAIKTVLQSGQDESESKHSQEHALRFTWDSCALSTEAVLLANH